jgi:hypothetical protein
MEIALSFPISEAAGKAECYFLEITALPRDQPENHICYEFLDRLVIPF